MAACTGAFSIPHRRLDDLPDIGPLRLDVPVPLAPSTLTLLARGIRELWRRILEQSPEADRRPLLLSYDVHPTPVGPVLIEINTNAGGILSALATARSVNRCCADWEQGALHDQLLALFRRDLLGPGGDGPIQVAIVDDALNEQPLRGEMQALARLLEDEDHRLRVLDAAELELRDGRLRHGETPIDRIYWRSTDFTLTERRHAPIRQALEAGLITLVPSPEAWRAIADKRRLIALSREPLLAADAESGLRFAIAQTLPLAAHDRDDWYARRRDWVFKPAGGHGSRGVYVGAKISRRKLASLPVEDYLAQAYAPHPVIDRDGKRWKYDLRLFADRDRIIPPPPGCSEAR